MKLIGLAKGGGGVGKAVAQKARTKN